MKTTKFFNFVKINMDRLKTVGFIVLLIFVLSLGLLSRCQKDNAIKLAEKMANLDFDFKQLEKEKDALNFKLFLTKKEREIFKWKADSLDKCLKKEEVINKNLKIELTDALGKIDEIPPDSSYKYLQAVYKPLEWETFNFPFTGSQVKSFHKDNIKLKFLNTSNMSLGKALETCKLIINNKVEEVENLDDQILILVSKDNMSYKQIQNKNKKIDVLNKELRGKNTWNWIWKFAAVTGFGIAVLK